MKFLFAVIGILLLQACSEEKVPNTDIDVARAFIKISFKIILMKRRNSS